MAQALKDLTIQVSNNEKRLKNTMSHFAFIYTFSMTKKMMTMEAVGSSVHNASVHLPNECARTRNDVRRLTSQSKIMESLRTFVVVETVLRRGRMFQGSDEV